MAAAERWAWLAKIHRTQGRKGEVFAEILTDFPEKFAERKHLWLLANGTARLRKTMHPEGRPGAPSAASLRPVELVAHWQHKGGIVLHFAGVDSISAAEELIGLAVAIPQAERAPLGQDEAYIGDLIGCMLVDVASSKPIEVGPIEDIDLTAGSAPLLVVKGARGEVLVPFAKTYLRRIDLEGKQVEMELPQGLVELNHES